MNTERNEAMEMDAIAAAARLALLGTSAELAVPFEELKPEIRDRWRGVVRVVQGSFWEELDALKVGWASNSHKAEEECERLRAAITQPSGGEGWEEKVEAAHDMVSALCLPSGSRGSREWIMSIPARPDHDPDLVITSGLMAAKKRIKELESALAIVEGRAAGIV